MQICDECRESKAWGDFHKDAQKKTGYRRKCKTCVKAYGQARYLANREDALTWRHDYYQRTREQTLETNRLYRERNADQLREKRLDLTPEQRERKRAAHNLWRYGLTQEAYDALLESQGGACGLCGDVVERFHVDHDHSCCPDRTSCGQCVRGLLCVNCNPMLGQAKDSIERLQCGIRYLERWQART